MPDAVGAERLLDLWDREKDGLLTRTGAADQGPLGVIAARASCSLALRGHDVSARLREAAVRPSSRDVLTVLVRNDAAWAVDHAVDIARSGGLREPIDVMYPLPDEDGPRSTGLAGAGRGEAGQPGARLAVRTEPAL